MKYYRVKVKLKNGFEYSYTCIHRMLEGMMQSSQSYWTESVTSEEINQEDFLKTREVSFEREPTVREDKVLRKAIVKSAKVVSEGKLAEKNPVEKKTRKVKMASLENFFEDSDPAPENKKRKKRV